MNYIFERNIDRQLLLFDLMVAMENYFLRKIFYFLVFLYLTYTDRTIRREARKKIRSHSREYR